MSTTPKWYLPVAILAMLWNMARWAAYLDDVMLDLYSLHPTWRVAVTAVAVWAGLAGSIGLIMRKRWTTPVLIASLVGVLLQDLNLFVLNGAAVSWEVPGAFVMQGMVLLIAIGLVLLARKASAHSWLS